MSERKCAIFTTDDYGSDDSWQNLMRCPACKGWLPSDFPIGKSFVCKKCGSTLETLPSIPETWTNSKGEKVSDEEDTDCEFGGRLCVVPEDIVKRTHGKEKEKK